MAVPGLLQLTDRDGATGPGGGSGGTGGSGAAAGSGGGATGSGGGSAGTGGGSAGGATGSGGGSAGSGGGSAGGATGPGGSSSGHDRSWGSSTAPGPDGARAEVPAVLRRSAADGPAAAVPVTRTSLEVLRRSAAVTVGGAGPASPVTGSDTESTPTGTADAGLATPRINPDAAAQMRQDVETIVGFLRDGMNNTQQRLVVSIARKWADRDTGGAADPAGSSARQRFPHLAKFMVLLQMRSYSRGSWWRDAYGIAYDDLFSELKDDRLTEFTALAEKCDAAATSGPRMAEQDNLFSYIGKREAVGLWGMLKGMGTTIVGGTVDTVLWATWKQTGEPLGRVLDRLGIRAEALKTAPKITPFLEKSFDDTAAILGRELNVDIHEQVDLGIAKIGTYELGTTGGKVVGGLTMAGAGGGGAGKGVESGLKVVGAVSTVQGLEQLGETVVKLRQGDPKAGIPPLTWAQIASRADLWAQLAAAAGGAVGAAGVKKLAVTLGIQGAQQALLIAAFAQVDADPRYPTEQARSAQKAELFAQIMVNGLTSIDSLHQAAKARQNPFGERNSVIGADPEPAGITPDPAARDQLFDRPGGTLGAEPEPVGTPVDYDSRADLFGPAPADLSADASPVTAGTPPAHSADTSPAPSATTPAAATPAASTRTSSRRSTAKTAAEAAEQFPSVPGAQTHATARSVRKQFSLTGSDVESAHVLPQAIGKLLPGYSPGKAITFLLPPDVHAAFDRGWIPAWERAKASPTGVTAQDAYWMIRSAIHNVPDTLMTPNTKGALEMQLGHEMFTTLGLSPDSYIVPPAAPGAGAAGAVTGPSAHPVE
jgi:hypothetical protein